MQTLYLPPEIVTRIVEHAAANPRHEVCGILGGSDRIIHSALPLENIDSKPDSRYSASPHSLLRAYRQLDDANEQVIGTYHSHPFSPPRPSDQDIRDMRQQLPGKILVIVSLQGSKPVLSAWKIDPDRVVSIELITSQKMQTDAMQMSPAERSAALLMTLLAVLALIAISISLLPPAPLIETAVR